ncbi:MAG: AsmA-like C-terminal region-containing protein [Bryobacteraceae bacterium]
MSGFGSLHPDLPRLLKIGGTVLAVLFISMGVVLATHWPFTRQAASYSLERVSSSEVHMGGFRKIFFPHPGYVIEDLSLTRNSGPNPPLVRVRRLRCSGSWFAVLSFTHRVREIRLDALHIYIPAHVPPPVRSHPSEKIRATVTEVIADGAILEIARDQANRGTLRFDFPGLTVSNVARGKSMRFRTLIHNPQPPGDITAAGTFGPLPTRNPGQAPVDGSFDFTHADLSTFRVIAGTLSAHGKFQGRLAHVEVRGQTDIPNFEVTRTGHALHLSAIYNATVNGLNGDVAIESVNAQLLNTTVHSRGGLATAPGGHGKTLSLDLKSSQGKIEDLLRLFVKSPRPPLTGSLVFDTHAVLPSEKKPFLQRVQLEGDFGITNAQFTSSKTEGKVSELSERAQGKKKHQSDPYSDPTLSDLRGRFVLRRGTATFAGASFSVPGAVARGEGTYNLLNERINLYGTLAMQASLSKAAGGVKSIFLKPLDPFFKKKNAGAVVPVQMTGTYPHPSFKVSLMKKRKSH